MAIDSAAKRRSLVGVVTGVMPVGVTPDVTQPQAWRQSAGWGYYGIEADEPAVPAATAPTVLPGSYRYRETLPGAYRRRETLPGAYRYRDTLPGVLPQ